MRGGDSSFSPSYLCGVVGGHGAIHRSGEWEGRGGGPAEGEGSEGMNIL